MAIACLFGVILSISALYAQLGKRELEKCVPISIGTVIVVMYAGGGGLVACAPASSPYWPWAWLLACWRFCLPRIKKACGNLSPVSLLRLWLFTMFCAR